LRVSRARAHPDISSHRNLGNWKSRAGRVENHNLSRAWKLHSIDRANSALPERPAARANFRHSRITKLDRCSSNRRFRSETHLSFVAAWLRHSHFAFSISFLGARGLRIRAGACGDVARWRLKKIRTLRFAAAGNPDAAGRRALLDVSARRPPARKHHLHWPGHDRAEAARL